MQFYLRRAAVGPVLDPRLWASAGRNLAGAFGVQPGVADWCSGVCAGVRSVCVCVCVAEAVVRSVVVVEAGVVQPARQAAVEPVCG